MEIQAKRLLTLVVALMLCMATCGVIPAVAESNEPIRVALNLPMTGMYAIGGEWGQNSVKMAFDEVNEAGGINGRKLEYVMFDNATDQTTAVNMMNRIVENEEFVAVIGPHQSTLGIAVSNIVKAAKIPYFAGGTSPTLLTLDNDYIFLGRANDRIVAESGAKFVVEDLGAKKIGVTYSNEDFGTAGYNVISKYLTDAGVDFVSEPHDQTSQDFTSVILKLQQQEIDALIIWSGGPAARLLAQAAYNMGADFKILTSSGFASVNMLDMMTAEEAVGIYSATDMTPTDPDPAMQAFVKKTQELYGYTPEAWSMCYYDAAHILAEAMKRAGDDITRETITNELYKIKDFPAVVGNMTVNADGEMIHGCVITVVTPEKTIELAKRISVD